MIDTRQRARIQRAINRLVKAEVANSDQGNRGLYADQTWAGVGQEITSARAGLHRALNSVTVDRRPK